MNDNKQAFFQKACVVNNKPCPFLHHYTDALCLTGYWCAFDSIRVELSTQLLFQAMHGPNNRILTIEIIPDLEPKSEETIQPVDASAAGETSLSCEKTEAGPTLPK